MRNSIIGKKIGMTQVFDENGDRIPVTVVKVDNNVVLGTKSENGKDGYAAVKVGYNPAHKFEKEGCEPRWRLSKPEAGVFLKQGLEPHTMIKEFRVAESDLEKFEVGQIIGPDVFTPGDYVDVTGTSKGSGFTGVMKRHNFRGTKASHGVHEFFRHGGSIGCSAYPARVFPGQKMAGQHGNARVTVQNLTVVEILAEDNAILIKGSVPGPKGGVVIIRSAIKKIID